MSFDFEGLDRFRERQRWIPAWLDDTDWKTWFMHTFVVLTWGWVLSLVTPLPLSWSWRFFVAPYLWREILIVRELRRDRKPLKPLDHVMDVLMPLLTVEVLNALT